jgi:N-acetylmuramoyl-L-alanine amidase
MHRATAHIDYTFSMIKSLFLSLRYLVSGCALCDWRLRMQAWWLGNDKTFLIFLPIVVLIMTTFSVVISKSVQERQLNRDLTCLAMNVYHEARGEPQAGQIAVARVTLNRVASHRYPDTVCEVVFQKKWDRIRRRYVSAFSWTELDNKLALDKNIWNQAWQVADMVYHQRDDGALDGALFYHATYIKPSWARKKIRVARIGQHIFYK